MAEKLQWERLVKLDELIRKRSYPNRPALAAELEVSERTIQRDLNYLRDRMDAPLAYNRHQGGYHYSEDTWFLPAIPLSEGEMFALMIARQSLAQYKGTPLAERLEAIFNKIAGTLTDRIHVQPDYAPDVLIFAPSEALPVNENVWNAVLKATRTQSRIRIRYASRRSGSVKWRTVDPYHVINMKSDWYLFAYDHDRKQVLQFMLNRIEQVRNLDIRFTRDHSFDLRQLVDSTFGSFGSSRQLRTVRLRVGGDMSELLAGRTLHPRQQIHWRRDGRMEISFPVSAEGRRPYFHLIQFILSLGRDVEVLAPAQLKKLVREELDLMRKKN